MERNEELISKCPIILVFGDSNVTGVIHTTEKKYFADETRFAGKIKTKYPGTKIFDYPGLTAEKSTSFYSQIAEQHHADITIICIGANDLWLGNDADSTMSYVKTLIAQSFGEIIYVSYPAIDYCGEVLTDKQQQYVNEREEFEKELSSLRCHVARLPENVTTAGRMHFTEEGHEIAFNIIDNEIAKILESEEYVYSEGYCYASQDDDILLMGNYLSEYANPK